MLNQARKILGQFKEFWDKQTGKRKILLLSILGGIIAVSVIAAVLLNSGKDGYVPLYTGLETTESVEIYRMLRICLFRPGSIHRGRSLFWKKTRTCSLFN